MKPLARILPLLLLLVAAAPASAEVTAGSGDVEFYVGGYFPEDAILDDDLTYGIRLGYNASDRWGFQASLGTYEDEGTVGKTKFDYRSYLVDLSAVHHFNPEDNSVFTLFGGIGMAFNDADPGGFGDDDSFTAHVGIAGRFSVSERIYLRLDGRGRWLEEHDDFDFETTFALGVRWGS